MRFLTIFLFAIYFTRLSGQTPTYVSFPDSNATWCAQRSFLSLGPPDEIHVYNYIQTISGDTLINGQNYHKIYESGLFIRTPLPAGLPDSSFYLNLYEGCIRETSNKEIYYIDKFSNNEYLLYDFNIAIGDTLQFANSLKVTSIDSIYDGSIYRAKYNISSIDTITWSTPGYFEYVSIIDGIGSTGGLLWSLGPYFEHWGVLYEYTQNGSLFYLDSVFTCNLSLNLNEQTVDNGIEIYPIPCYDKLNVILKEENLNANIFIYDITGKLLINEKLDKKRNELDLAKYKNGIYLFKIFDKIGYNYAGKFIKQ